MNPISDFSIVNATKDDAPLIAKAVAMALDIDIEAPGDPRAEWCRKVFGTLAARDDAQYSYLNTLKAVTPDGTPVGFLVNYDGARLHQLREAFFEVVRNQTGEDMRGISDETDPDEWYLDSLAVWPEYRNLGIGHALMEAGIARAHKAGKPAGLLVDKNNPRARRMYEKLGFEKVGDRPFARTMMDHMRTPAPCK